MIVAPAAAGARQKAAEAGVVERCAEQLVPYADWPKVTDRAMSLELTAASGGRVRYFGAGHSSDPADPQFAAIEKAWNAFKPTVAFYEGPNRPIAATAEETIRQAGESGYVRFLARRDGIPFMPLEPPPQEEAASIMKKYPEDQVMLFYVLREATRLRDRRGMKEAELKPAIATLLERAAKMAGLDEFKTIEDLNAAYRRYWKTPANWWEAPHHWFDPLNTSKETGGVFTNEINKLSSEYRNRHMYTLLATAALEGKRAFAVVGGNHVPMQAPALRCAVK
jgi:hypothetical protein